MRHALAAAAAAGLLLTGGGCAVPAPTPASPETAQQVAAAVALPTSLRIPKLHLDTPLVGVGLNPDGTLATPPVTDPQQAAWYQLGVRPGQVGPAVVLGHVSGRPVGAPRSVPGVFAHLDQLRAGDRVEITRADGTTVAFTVTHSALYPKSDFPTAVVYGNTAGPELRLITCSGAYDPAARNYLSNLVVDAVAA